MRVSKSLYMLSIIGAPILAIILILVAVMEIAVSPLEAGLLAFSLALEIAIALLIYALVMECVLLYKAWKVIQDGYARTSPGKAVGFCLYLSSTSTGFSRLTWDLPGTIMPTCSDITL